MFKKLSRARSFLYSFLFPTGKINVNSINKIIEHNERDLRKTPVVLSKSEISANQTPTTNLSMSGRTLTSWFTNKEGKCVKSNEGNEKNKENKENKENANSKENENSKKNKICKKNEDSKGKEINEKQVNIESKVEKKVCKENKESKEKEQNKLDKEKLEEKKEKVKKESENKAKEECLKDADAKKAAVNENPCKGKENLAAVLYKSHDLKLESRKKPLPNPGEVVIAMNCVGLSSTDFKYYTKGELPTPLVLGREGTGIVAMLGQGVKNLREGDRVVIQPNVPCGECEFCKNCLYDLCSHPKSCGLEPYDGLLTCYHAHSANYCHKLPERITMEEGVLMNMLANCINACSRCPMCVGADVLVIGAGPAGLMSLIAAKAMGATNTCILCKSIERLKLARQYYTKTVMICDGAQPEDIAQTVREQMNCAPKITIDAVGSADSIKLAVASTVSGGSIVLTNIVEGPGMHDIPLSEIAKRDITVRSALRPANKFPAAIALADTGSIDLKSLISHHIFFENVSEAFETLTEDQENVNKIVVHIRPRDRNNKTPF